MPIEGVITLEEPSNNTKLIVNALTNYSLLEKSVHPHWLAEEYFCPDIVSNALDKKIPQPLENTSYTLAADYLRFLFDNERTYFGMALIVHNALKQAKQTEESHQFAWNYILGELQTSGQYRTLLENWLPDICTSNNLKTKANALNRMGMQYLHLADYNNALTYLKQARQIQQDIGNKQGEAATLNNISQIYKAQGDYERALDYLNQSLKIQQEIDNKVGLGVTLNNISLIYKAQRDYERALDYLNLSLKIRQEIGDKAGFGTTLNNISQIYDAQGNYERALDYLNQSLEIVQEIGDKKVEGATLNNISQIYDAQGDYERASHYLNQSLKILQEISDIAGMCATLFNMGNMQWENNNHQTAIQHWVDVYVTAKKINLAEILNALENLANDIGLTEHVGAENGLAAWEVVCVRNGINTNDINT